MRKNYFILLVILATIFITFLGTQVYARIGQVSDNAILAGDKLSQLGILNGYSDGSLSLDKTITRAEFTTMIMRMTLFDKNTASNSYFTDVPDSHWAREYINAAKEQNLIEGRGSGLFQPDSTITVAEAETIIEKVMGYESTLHGSWPFNVVSKADELGLENGIDTNYNSPAYRGDIAILLSNALEIPMMEENGTDTAGNKVYRINDNKTILSYYLGLNSIKSKIMDVPSADSALSSNQFKIDLSVYSLKNNLADSLLNKTVTFFSDSKKQIKYLRITDENTFKILYDTINSIDGNSITLDFNNAKYSIDDTATLYIDDKKNMYMNKVNLNMVKKGQFGKFLISNGKITEISIITKFKYDSYIVQSVDPGNKYIYYQNSSNAINLLRLKSNYDYTTIHQGGKEITLGDMRPGMVFSMTETGHNADIYVSPYTTVTGSLLSLNSDGALLSNGMSYEIASQFTYSKDNNSNIYLAAGSNELKDLINTQVTLYLDLDGKIRHIFSNGTKISNMTALVLAARTADKQYVDVFNMSSNKLETYVYPGNTNLGVLFDALNLKAASNIDETSISTLYEVKPIPIRSFAFDAVNMTVNSDGTIASISKFTQLPEQSLVNISPKGSITTDKSYNVDDNTVFVDFEVQASKTKLAFWSSIKDVVKTDGAKVVILPDASGSRANTVIFSQGTAKLGYKDEYGTVAQKDLVHDNPALKVSTAGGLENWAVSEIKLFNDTNVGDVIAFRLNPDQYINEIVPYKVTEAKIEASCGDYIQLQDNKTFYKLSDKVMIYDLTGSNLNNLKSDDLLNNIVTRQSLKAGQGIRYAVNENQQVQAIFIIN